MMEDRFESDPDRKASAPAFPQWQLGGMKLGSLTNLPEVDATAELFKKTNSVPHHL